jgi:putative molybdopterin biosynthesis protein
VSDSYYLHDIPLPEAQARLWQALQAAGLGGRLGQETLPLDENALGRVLAQSVWANISSPHYHAAAMDGFAVASGAIAGAQPNAPVVLECGRQTEYVDTGDPLPEWADAVVPIESVEALASLDPGRAGELAPDPRRPAAIRLRAALPPWSHVRPLGEDIVATQLVLPAGHTLRPVDLGAIAASGHAQVTVARRPRLAVLPSGDELAPIGQPVRAGEIIEYNSLVLAAQVKAWGGLATRFPITPDNFEALCARVLEAARDHDLILLNAGSSAGSQDYTARVVAALGELLVHGVAVRPGHPVVLGLVQRQPPPAMAAQPASIPIIGVPGYPVSAALTGELFVAPLLDRWLGRPARPPQEVVATLTRKLTSPPGDDDFVRVALGRVGERLLAAPLARGAGVITSLVRADGLAHLPPGVQGLLAGAELRVRLYRTPAEIEQAIFVIGSHDLSLDLLAQFLAERGRRLASANVGSLGGLLALRRREAHLAGSHLLDPASGEFNLPFLRQYLPGLPLRLVGLVERQQGLMVPRGNPQGLASLADLARPELTFVNRQRGAGTRLLLDYQLDLLGIAAESVRGYNQEEYTHLAVAAAVASGRASCGLGIAAAAQALELDFIPLFSERYDLVIPLEHYHSRLLEPLLETLADQRFRQAVAALPGYDPAPMGTILAELG